MFIIILLLFKLPHSSKLENQVCRIFVKGGLFLPFFLFLLTFFIKIWRLFFIPWICFSAKSCLNCVFLLRRQQNIFPRIQSDSWREKLWSRIKVEVVPRKGYPSSSRGRILRRTIQSRESWELWMKWERQKKRNKDRKKEGKTASDR